MRRALIFMLSALMLFASATDCGAYVIYRDNIDGCDVYSAVKMTEKKLALTFDDGPHPKKTPEILDVLKKYDVHATFFQVGQNVAENPELADRIIAEGHEIGNHTYTHCISAEARRVKEEIERCEDEISRHSEYKTRLFRPPGGNYNADYCRLCAELGYTMILWSIDTKDWQGRDADGIFNEVKNAAAPGRIVLMHDFVSGRSHTAEALEMLIPYLLSEGYTLVTVSELISE